MPITDLAYPAMYLLRGGGTRYTLSGTDLSYLPMHLLRPRYAISGPDLACTASRCVCASWTAMRQQPPSSPPPRDQTDSTLLSAVWRDENALLFVRVAAAVQRRAPRHVRCPVLTGVGMLRRAERHLPLRVRHL
eukprot:2588414-Rhodomonas_salina.2